MPEAPSAARRRRRLAEQVRAVALGVGFPLMLILLWDRAVAITGTRLVPSPREVAVMMYDFSFGGVYDDAFSATILTHIWKSMTRVYGGFFLAALIGIPLGLMIGRIKLLRQLLDPTINLLRPIPVTAWLPLSMIFFGLGPNAAIFLVFLGAFYPILLNTIFGVRSVDVRLFEAAAMLGCSGSAMFRQIVFPASLPAIFNGLRIAHGFAWILRVVAGFEEPTTGEVLVGAKPVTAPGSDRGMVFQDYALFPWMTVRQNIGFGPRQRQLPRKEVEDIADEFVKLVGLEHAANRYPSQLSGGMKQRVAIARVLANNANILLMDEPFGALDALTREQLQRELLQIWTRTRVTILFVTHSVEEAALLADRVLVMSAGPGRIESDIRIDLPRPRDVSSPEFNAVRRELAH